MAKDVRLADIAERLAVSTVTVSKALSGQKGVSENLRERIRRLADEMGYKQPSAQPGEKRDKSYNIGVLVAARYMEQGDSFYLQMYQQVATRAMAEGGFTLMEVVSGRAEAESMLPMLVQEQKADGMIVIGRLADGYLDRLEETDVPVVYLDFCSEKRQTDAVVADNYYGAYRLTNYLFDMGHRHIGYVGTLLSAAQVTDRYFGYARSMLEHGEQIRPEWVLEDREKTGGLIDPVRFMQLPEEMPTAFVCSCDLAAGYFIKKLREHGCRVPEDVSVTGYDNYLLPELCDVALTTCEVDIKEMARRALRILIRKMNRETYRSGISIVDGHLVIRESVKKL